MASMISGRLQLTTHLLHMAMHRQREAGRRVRMYNPLSAIALSDSHPLLQSRSLEVSKSAWVRPWNHWLHVSTTCIQRMQ